MCDIGLYLFCLLCNIKDSYMEYVTKRLKCFKYYITTSAVRALVISPRTWITPSIGAMGCKSIATIRGRSPFLHEIQRGKGGRINYCASFTTGRTWIICIYCSYLDLTITTYLAREAAKVISFSSSSWIKEQNNKLAEIYILTFLHLTYNHYGWLPNIANSHQSLASSLCYLD